MSHLSFGNVGKVYTVTYRASLGLVHCKQAEAPERGSITHKYELDLKM